MNSSKKYSSFSTAVYCAIWMIAVAQLNINLVVAGMDNIKISLAVVLLPIMMFLLEDLSVFFTTLLVVPGVFLGRCIFSWLEGASFSKMILSNSPEMAFYLVYGLLFMWYTKRVALKPDSLLSFAPLVAIDLLSNLVEIFIRMGGRLPIQLNIISQFAMIALIRSMIAAGLVSAFDAYSHFMLKKDDRERYKRLMLMLAEMKGELVWMRKNTAMIEHTMSTTYHLYQSLKQQGSDELSAQALTVAKDIHEIKKEYALIMRGLSSCMQGEQGEDGMWLQDILDLVSESFHQEIAESQKFMELTVDLKASLYTDKHYELMSVLRNLLTNSLEACKERGTVELHCKKQEDLCVLQVIDNCGGVPEEYRERLFSHGFSTKISMKTGEVGRGLGLCLVKDIIETELGGVLMVEFPKRGTAFQMKIPLRNLEV